MASIILPHGRLNLETGISQKPGMNSFDVIECDKNGGWLELWKSDTGKFKVVRTWVGKDGEPWNKPGDRTEFRHDQTRRMMNGVWTLKGSTPVENIAIIQKHTGKRVLDVACYK
jgi:hypothetical protein